LRSCEELGVVRRSADAVALRICNEALFPTRSPPGWWTTKLAALSPVSFQKVVTALRCRRADPEVVANAASAYAELTLAEVLADPRDTYGGPARASRVHRERAPFRRRRSHPGRLPLPPPPRRGHHRGLRQDVPRPGAPRRGGAGPGHRGGPAGRRARRRRRGRQEHRHRPARHHHLRRAAGGIGGRVEPAVVSVWRGRARFRRNGEGREDGGVFFNSLPRKRCLHRRQWT
ncbi:hypothetical protein BAE44_0023187, partial [Dichanthelium oligosanthes]